MVWECCIRLSLCCWKDAALIFLRSSRYQALTWLPKGLVLICRWTIMNTARRGNTSANNPDRCSCEHRSWIVVRIDLPLATDPVFPSPSRLANVRYCLIRLVFILECWRRITTWLITRVVANLLLSSKTSWILKLNKFLDALTCDVVSCLGLEIIKTAE